MRSLGLMLTLLWMAAPAAAQVLPQLGRGELPPLRLPDFVPEARTPGAVLPPVVMPESGVGEPPASGGRVFVRSIRISGVTELPRAEVEALAAPYLDRELSFEDLQALRDAITLAYVERGFVSSGAVIPPQRIEDGVLRIEVVEGRVGEIEYSTDGRFREGYIRRRLGLGDGPVNLFALEERLQRLQRDPRIKKLDAQLMPGDVRGESALRLALEEGPPVRAVFSGNNYRPPAVGSYQGQGVLQVPNVSGWGDSFWASFSGSEGTREVDAAYEVPVTRFDTVLDLHFRWIQGDVIESVFEFLDIESDSYTVGGGVNQPLYVDLQKELNAFLIFEYRRSESYLLGEPFSFSPGPIDGVAKVLALRVGLEAAYRSTDQVFSLRSILSRGFEVPGSTRQARGIPDGDFWAWLLQAQYAYRLPWFDLEFLARTDLQLADRPLLPLEQFAMGGHGTVNGYRENSLVRDNGVVGSIALRRFFDLPTKYLGFLAIGPFFDVGHGWNRKRAWETPPSAKTIYSVGVSAHLRALDHLDIMLSYGYALTDRPRATDWDLQDSGVQFNVVLTFP